VSRSSSRALPDQRSFLLAALRAGPEHARCLILETRVFGRLVLFSIWLTVHRGKAKVSEEFERLLLPQFSVPNSGYQSECAVLLCVDPPVTCDPSNIECG
jgi:hypothetical protein